MLKITATALIVAWSASNANADPIILSCRSVDGSHPIGYREIDRIIIDPAANLMQFEIARTMGTKFEDYWTFSTKPTYGETFEVHITEGSIWGSGIFRGRPAVLEYRKDGSFRFAHLRESIDWYEWRCRE